MGKPRRKLKGHTRSCGTKQKFDTLAQAESASRRRWEYMQAYQCKKCGKFHYGTSERFKMSGFQA